MSRWLEDYSYELPPGQIAQRPSRFRDRSRLMVLRRDGGSASHRLFSSLPEYLGDGDLLVLNDSSVRPARLLGRKEVTGGQVELLLFRHLGAGRWRALLKGRAAAGSRLDFGIGSVGTRVVSVDGGGEVTVTFDPPEGGKLLMEKVGVPPLPPYVRRTGEDLSRLGTHDRLRYQTVYAGVEGSVAAPTAGLHFTKRLLEGIRRKGAETVFLTLHVGPGTFRPLRNRDVTLHRLGAESAFLPASTAAAVNRVKRGGGKVVAVGTTTTRALESFTGADGRVRGGRKLVDLYITPGFKFRTVDALLTNFHLPRSSLLLLVSAFAGRERVLKAYGEAIERSYRFYSYGDAMFIL